MRAVALCGCTSQAHGLVTNLLVLNINIGGHRSDMVYPPNVSPWVMWCSISGPQTDPVIHYTIFHRLDSACMCVFAQLANNHAGRVCMLSGFLSRRLADQNEPRVWRVCPHRVFVVSSCAITLSSCSPTLLSWCCERGKETCAVPLESCCACTREPLFWLQLVHVT